MTSATGTDAASLESDSAETGSVETGIVETGTVGTLRLEALHLETRAIVAGRNHDGSGLAPALWPSSTFASPDLEECSKRGARPRSTDFYSRLGNPSVQAFADAVAELEGAEAGMAFASGMGAISSTILGLCSQGSHIVAQRQLFTSTSFLFTGVCARFGIDVTLVDASDTQGLIDAVRPGETQVIFVETPSNPTMELVDLDAIGAIKGPIKIVDSTFATPLLQRPIDHGCDIVIHSATKTLAGHNDATLGVVLGERELVDHIWGYSVIHGACASPFDAWNGIRGLRTLGVRVERQNASAAELASRLATMPGVSAVHYPGLDSHPQAEIVRRQMSGGGGCVSFDLAGGAEAVRAFVDKLNLIYLAPSLGGTETLVNHPASMTHAKFDPEERLSLGIGDGLIRMSVGLEHVDDIWCDLEQALHQS